MPRGERKHPPHRRGVREGNHTGLLNSHNGALYLARQPAVVVPILRNSLELALCFSEHLAVVASLYFCEPRRVLQDHVAYPAQYFSTLRGGDLAPRPAVHRALRRCHGTGSIFRVAARDLRPTLAL